MMQQWNKKLTGKLMLLLKCTTPQWVHERISNITHLMNCICELKEIKQGKNLPRYLFPMSIRGYFFCNLNRKKWVTLTFWEKLNFLHPSIYANQLLGLYQLTERGGLSESDSKGVNEPTEAEIVKSFFHPLKWIVVLTTAFYCAYSTRTVLIQTISQNR